jgi:transcriptional regulator with XRE-family HTH domain
MNHFGERVRSLRESKGLLLRQAAAFLEVDTAFMSKVERGQKRASREQARKLAVFLSLPEEQLMPLWLADRILETIKGDPFAHKALKIVKQKVN